MNSEHIHPGRQTVESRARSREIQGGRCVRRPVPRESFWRRNAGTIATAIGWVFIFIAIALPQAASYAPLRFDMCVCGSACIGFAVGWYVCRELR